MFNKYFIIILFINIILVLCQNNITYSIPLVYNNTFIPLVYNNYECNMYSCYKLFTTTSTIAIMLLIIF
jgi:hypothetical protein